MQSSTIVDKRVVADPRYKAYQPWGSSLDMLYGKEPEILICGPAGTGKSRGVLEKIHLCACKYPGMRALIIRKTRTSVTQSAQVTFEEFVIPDNGTVKFRTAQQEYRYSNGSKIVIGGMDKSSKVLSSEYDLIYYMEATEGSDEDWEILLTRNRFGVMPYNQLIGCCNPGPPSHWLHQRSKVGPDPVCRYIKSVHQDNPVLWDHARKNWTKKGEAYIRNLKNLTGVRKLRLYKGIWAAAEGMVYEEEWDEDIHKVNRFTIPPDWLRLWVVDFGYTNPFVWQAWAYDSDNDTAYRYAEIYHTKLLVEDAAALIKAYCSELGEKPRPYALICDWDAEGRATLERHLDVQTTLADKAISDGIDSVKSRLRTDGNGNYPKGKCGLYFMRDSLYEIDHDLKDRGLPTCTEEEIESYVWNDKIKKERPMDRNDHGMDDVRYLSKYLDGESMGWTQGMGN